MTRQTLCPIDGASAFAPREVRDDSSTMRDLRLSDGTWMLYDRSRGRMEFVRWQESGFVASPDGVMIGVTEVHRQRYTGVL